MPSERVLQHLAEPDAAVAERARVTVLGGRLLRGRLVRARLKEVTAEPVSIPVTDRVTVETLIPLFNPEAMQLGRIPRELVGPWLTAFEAALAWDDFLAVLTIWVATGVKIP